jgi:hypothetical protein
MITSSSKSLGDNLKSKIGGFRRHLIGLPLLPNVL